MKSFSSVKKTLSETIKKSFSKRNLLLMFIFTLSLTINVVESFIIVCKITCHVIGIKYNILVLSSNFYLDLFLQFMILWICFVAAFVSLYLQISDE